MDRVTFFFDGDHGGESIGPELGGIFDLRILPIGRIHDIPPGECQIFDIDLHNPARLKEVKQWLAKKPDKARVIVAIDETSRTERIQAYALGATEVIQRPVTSRALLILLLGDFSTLTQNPAQTPFSEFGSAAPVFRALENIFNSAYLNGSIDLKKIHAAGELLITDIEARGLGSWIECMRHHDSITYQHTLIVTSVIIAFGQKLGFSKEDQKKLYLSGMLHDIGKARIPLSILEKPGPLNAEETAVMQRHPVYGYEALASAPDIPDDVRDLVLHHHELLDGSGYPHGLGGEEISDLVRIMTISDIFGALIERRPYRPPMSGENAHRELINLRGKLDQDLVREFRSVVLLASRPA